MNLQPFAQKDIFTNTAYGTVGQVLSYNANIFNEKSNGAIRMDASTFAGNAQQQSNVRIPKNLLKYRSVTGTQDLTAVRLYRDTQNQVKFAMGTNPLNYTGAELTYLKQSPAAAGALYGQAIGIQSAEEMAKLAVAALTTCLKSDTRVVTDITKKAATATVGKGILTPQDLVSATRPFGDAFQELSIIVIHSKVYMDLMQQNIFGNANDRVYRIGSMTYAEDVLGRRYLVTDNPALYDDTTKVYTTLGLRTNRGVTVGMNSDFNTAMNTITGKENITYEVQSEWTNTLNVDNYRYKLESTNNAADLDYAKITSAANWEIVDDSSVKLQSGFVITSL